MGSKLLVYLLFCAFVCVSKSKPLGDELQSVSQTLHTYLDSLPKGISIDDFATCTSCKIVADLLIAERKLGMTNEQLVKEADFVCTLLKIESATICEGIIRPNVDVFAYMIDNTKDISGKRICGLILPEKDCDSEHYDWSIDVPEGNTVDKPKAIGTNPYNVLHISDIHYDPRYTPGKTTQCGAPLCCQDDQDDGSEEGTSCGYWAEYISADTPIQTVEEAFKQMATHEFDFVYYTGDTIRHRVWSTSTENNTKEIITITICSRNTSKSQSLLLWEITNLIPSILGLLKE
uniref:Sphingomyelin phosphodiesterase 1 n=1 Tax=Anoplophora glabripennis TaxID=217634 RepID=V5G074_ANOGL